MPSPPDPGRRKRREQHVERTYGVTASMLAALEAYQADQAGVHDGIARCWGCRHATGAAKALAMDHNHRTNEARMLLCSHCNRYVVGHFRDNPIALIRLGLALVYPPSRVAWAQPGKLPGWATEGDDELAEWLEERGYDRGE